MLEHETRIGRLILKGDLSLVRKIAHIARLTDETFSLLANYPDESINEILLSRSDLSDEKKVLIAH